MMKKLANIRKVKIISNHFELIVHKFFISTHFVTRKMFKIRIYVVSLVVNYTSMGCQGSCNPNMGDMHSFNQS